MLMLISCVFSMHADINWQFQVGGMYGILPRYFAKMYDGQSTNFNTGLMLQIPLKNDKQFIETGLGYNARVTLFDNGVSSSQPHLEFAGMGELYLPIKFGWQQRWQGTDCWKFSAGPYASAVLYGPRWDREGNPIYSYQSDYDDYDSKNQGMHFGLELGTEYRWDTFSLGLSYRYPVFTVGEFTNPWEGNLSLTLSINFGSERWADIGAVALAVGSIAGAAAEAYAVTQGGSSSYSNSAYSNSSSGSSSRSKSDSDSKYDLSEQQNFNADKKVYYSYETYIIQANSGNRSASASEINDWKSKMRQIRQKWAAKGKTITKSPHED